MIERALTPDLRQDLLYSPAVALLGPRQCGKTTLARLLCEAWPEAIYLDLELPSDLRKLHEPELFLREKASVLVVLDEIQHRPDLFPILRSLIDQDRRPGRFLILGSASPELLRQSSETLAGRLLFRELTPLSTLELAAAPEAASRHWFRGGYPPSLLSVDDAYSFRWRSDFIRTFVERDIPSFGITVQAATFARFLQLLAHWHGELMNWSKCAEAAGIAMATVRQYVALLEHAYILRVLRPLDINIKKRLVKSPRIYFRDSGLLHVLLEIHRPDALAGHLMVGASWEGYVIENLCSALPDWRPGFYRTAAGAELDLVLEKGDRRIGIECKRSLSPNVSKGFHHSCADLGILHALIVAPVPEGYPFADNVRVESILGAVAFIKALD